MSKGFPGFPGGASMQGLLKQAQKMKKDFEKAQEEIESYEVEVSGGGGAVKAKVNGKYQVKELEISKEMAGDPELLRDTLLVVINNGLAQIKEHSEKQLAKVTGGGSMPGLF